MATPTRLDVLLQTRKSAAAGPGRAASAPARAAGARIRQAARRHVAMVESRLMPGGVSLRKRSRSVNDDGAEIIDVGGGGAGRQQVAERGKEPRRLVVG